MRSALLKSLLNLGTSLSVVGVPKSAGLKQLGWPVCAPLCVSRSSSGCGESYSLSDVSCSLLELSCLLDGLVSLTCVLLRVRVYITAGDLLASGVMDPAGTGDGD